MTGRDSLPDLLSNLRGNTTLILAGHHLKVLELGVWESGTMEVLHKKDMDAFQQTHE